MLISGTWILRDPFYGSETVEGFMTDNIDEPNISTFSTVSSFGDVNTWNGIKAERDPDTNLPLSIYYYRGNIAEIVGSYSFSPNYWGEDTVYNYDRISFGNNVVDIPENVYRFITTLGFQESKPPYLLEFWTPVGATKYPYKTAVQIEELPTPYLRGYEFIGWEYSRLGSRNFAEVGDVLLQNTKLYAKFNKIETPPEVVDVSATTPFFHTYNAFMIKKSVLDRIWNEGLKKFSLNEIVFGEDTLNYIQNVSISPFTRKNLTDVGATFVEATPYSLLWNISLTGDTLHSFTHDCKNTFDVCSFTIEEHNKDFRDYSPYSTYELYLPYYGYVNLNINNIINKHVIVKICVDYYSGNCTYYLYADDEFVYSCSCNLYLKLPIVRTNASEVVHSVLNQTSKIILAGVARLPLLSRGSELTQAIMAANSYQLATNGLAGIFDTLGGADVSSSTPEGFDKIYMPNIPYIRITRANVELYDSVYYGKPCFDSLPLSVLNGYAEIGDIHLENINATQEELDEIVSLLKSGVIF